MLTVCYRISMVLRLFISRDIFISMFLFGFFFHIFIVSSMLVRVKNNMYHIYTSVDIIYIISSVKIYGTSVYKHSMPSIEIPVRNFV